MPRVLGGSSGGGGFLMGEVPLYSLRGFALGGGRFRAKHDGSNALAVAEAPLRYRGTGVLRS